MTDTAPDLTHLDGNALAGALQEVFAVDVTVATCTCAGCGRTGPFAELHVYTRAPGAVARCPACDRVLLRLVRTPREVWLDAGGMLSLRFSLPGTP